MKQNILFFCSWLDIKSPPSFFYEQAEAIIDDFNPILVVFKEREVISITKIFGKFFGINSQWNRQNRIPMLEIQIPVYAFLPNYIKRKVVNSAVKYLKSVLEKQNELPALIHAQSVFDAGIWAYKYHFHYKTPYLITEHNQIGFVGVDKNKFYYFEQAMQKAKYRLVVSNDKIRQFAANSIFYEFKNIGNLISPIFSFKPTKNTNGKIKFISIGAFSKMKDQETILKALKEIDSKIDKSISWTWIGSNSWGKDNSEIINNLLKQYPLKNIIIEIKPLLNRLEILEELQKSDLFLHSSIVEGMPVSVLESLACGVPVFSTFCGGVEEVINITNGRLYSIKDSKTLAEYLLDFISNTHMYDSEKISIEILKRYGKNAFKANILEIYTLVLNDTRN
jgi:glycosyltransferase involved in cell wall biosynthesis